MHVTAVLTPAEEGGFNAYNPETGTGSQGDTIEKAVANLREAVILYLEEFPLHVSGAPLVTTFHISEHVEAQGAELEHNSVRPLGVR